MDPEQRKFLQGRFRKVAIEQPDLKTLKALLLRLGGEYMVPPMGPDSDVPALIKSGFLMHGPIRLKKLKTSRCHQNVAALWRNQKPQIVAIATGYALSNDGLWRQHSWGLLRDGVLETTEERTRYFGILLQGAEADHFVACNPC